MSDGGKGSAPRPLGIDWDKFEENWDAIFGNDNSNNDSVGVFQLRDGKPCGDCGGAQHGPEHKPSK